MSRRRGAFSAFEKSASQAEDTAELHSGSASAASASRSGIRRTAKALSADEAKRLLESLRVASSQADFQKALTNLQSRGWGALKKREAVARLLAMAWKASLKAAGFGIDQWGFPEMLAAVRMHHADLSIRRLSEEVERHLRFQPGDLFGSKAGALKQTSSAAEAAAVSEVEVQVTVTHPTDRDSVVVTVPGSASMKQVKEALATKLQRPEITRNGRMVVESQNGDLLPVPDGQRLGGKRQVFMVGISLSAPSSFAAPPVPADPRAPTPVQPKPTRDRPLNLGEAKELLKAFREIASSKEFQRTLGNIHKQGPDSVQKMQPMFIGQSFNRTLAMYDFPLSNEGYQDMARGISKHSWNVHVKAQAHEVERLLRMPPGAFFGIPGEPGQEPEYPPLEQEPESKLSKSQVQPKTLPSRLKGIEVVAKHAVDNVEVRVELPQNATFYDCKQAISKLLGRDEILRKGRLVQKKGGVYSAFKDEDLLGETRQVLVLGADLSSESLRNDPMPPVHPYAMGSKTSRRSSELAGLESDEDPGPPAVEPYSVKRGMEPLEPPKRVKEVSESHRFEPNLKEMPKPKETPKPKAKEPKEPKEPKAPEEYEIRIKHAVESGEVSLKIWSNWTFGTVRDALAKKLKREEISKKARFVFKAGTGTAPWVAFKDQEVVGWTPDGSRRNEVMLLGIDLAPEPSEGLDLSLELTQRLLQEFEKACLQEETQAALEKLLDRGGVALQLGLSQLMGQASQKAAEVVGVGSWKLQRLMDAVKAHGKDRKVVELANSVEKILRLENGKLFGLRQVSSTASAIKGLLGRSQVQDDVAVDESEADSGPPDLNVQQAVAMQRELHAGFADAGFQQRLENLETFHRKDPKLILLRQELFLSVQSKVLPKYGFRGDLKGVLDMLEAFKKPEFQQNYDFMRLGSELNALLRLTPDGRPRPPVKEVFPEPAKQSSVVKPLKPPQETSKPTAARNEVVRDIEVIIRHAVEEDHPDEEARFTVKSNATMKAVKEALIKHLGKPELLQRCRLVQRVGENGAFSGFKDSEKLNGRRALLVLGVPSLRTAGEEEEVKVLQMEPPIEAPVTPVARGTSVARREVPQLTLGQALALQRDLLQGFSDAEFQSKRKELVRLYKHSDPKRFGAERQKLFLSVQKIILPKYGFEAGPKGVFDMLEQFDRSEMVTNATFQQQGAALNQLLFADDFAEGSSLERSSEAMAASPRPETSKTARKEVVRDVEVVVRHAVEEDHPADEEARFTVKSNANMKMVKEALIKHLGKPELLHRCRLVQRVGENGAFSGFKDSEKLNGRRALLVLGIPSLRTAGDEALDVAKPPEPEQSSPAEAPARPAPVAPVLRSKPESVAAEIREPPTLTIQQVLALQHDLLQGFSDPEFQSKRKELVRLYKHSDPKRFSVERQKLFLSVQKLVLPKYGFEGGPKGVFEMMQQFDQADFLMNPMFQQQGAILNQLLFAEDLPEAIQSSEVAKPASSRETSKTHKATRHEVVQDFEVLVRHAVEEDHPADEEARFTVKSNATMKTVKEALIKHLGKPELLHSCRLVQRAGENGAFLGFKDSEKLNGRRALLVLGLSTLRTAEDEALDVKGAITEIKQSSQEAPLSRLAFPAPSKPSAPSPAPPREPPKLTIPQALSLQRDLMRGFSDPEFQSKRKDLVRLYKHSDPKRFSVERQKLFLSVQKLVLPKYGFEGGPKGVFEMMQQFDQADFLMNPMFQQQGATLNQLLFAEDLNQEDQSSEVAKPASSRETSKTHKAARHEVVRDFEVLVRHAVEEDHPADEVLVRHAVEEDHPADEEARFTVKSNATMKTVKEALIKHLGKPELLTTCRLVQRVGENGAFVSFKDSEKLNGRRALLVLGLPSLRTAGEEAAAAVLDKDQHDPSPVVEATEIPAETVAPKRNLVTAQPMPSMPPPKLTVATALALQRDLLQGFSDAEFQSKRQELVRLYKHSDPKRFSAERQKLFLSVQKMVLPKYGFEGGPKGVFEMLQQFDQKELVMNTTIQEQGDALNQLLFSEDLQAEAQAVHKSLKIKQDLVETEILLSIRHAIEEDAKDMIQLKVTSSWTIKEIKEALADQLSDPQILQTRRFVRRVGESGAFSSLTDAERLGKRRSLLVLGVPTLRPPDLSRAKQRKTASRRDSATKLTPAQAVALQQDLYDGFAAPTFRARLEKLWQQKSSMDSRKYRAERQRLFLSVQSVVLPKYGLEGNPRGVFEMLSQFDQPELHGNEEFQEMGQRLNDLLFKGEPEATSAPKDEAEAPKEVQVRVRRAGDENKEEVHVIVLSTASMQEVRAAVARKCNNPSFLQKGRLVRNQGGVLVGYQDSELLRGRRRLLFVGPPLWPDGAPKVSSVDGEESEDGSNQNGSLSLPSARRFLEKVKAACSRDEFQQQLLDATARARQKSDAALLRMGIGALFISSCRHLLRKFGFPDTRQGYDQMFGAIFPHGQDPEVFKLTRQIEELLGVPAGSWFGIDTEEDVLQETPELSYEEGKRLVAEVRRLVAAPNFQREIVFPGLDQAQRAREVYMPLYQLLRPTLLSFGFRVDLQCIQRLQQTVARLKDSKLHGILQEVETQLLRVAPGALLGLAPAKAPETVKLRIRHAVSHVEVRVNVSTEAIMSDILEALAKTVGSEDVQKHGRLVYAGGGGSFTSFQATEKLGKRRRLLFLGADLPSKDATSKSSNLTRDEAIQLQLELLDAFRSEDFQAKLEELKATLKDGASYYVERRKLVLSVQTKVIPKFGFASDLGGVLEMVRLLGSLPDDDGQLSQRGFEIERLIGERESTEISHKDMDRGRDTDASEEVVDVQESGMEEPTDGSVPDALDFMTALDKLDDEMPDTDGAGDDEKVEQRQEEWQPGQAREAEKERIEDEEAEKKVKEKPQDERAEEDKQPKEARDAKEARQEEERPVTQAREAEEDACIEEESRATEAEAGEADEERKTTEDREAEEARLEERRATEARQAEEARMEEERRAEEARKAEEARLEEERRAEEAREAEEARQAKEARQAEEVRLEEERRATQAREAEEARLEEERRAKEAREAEEARLEEERRAKEARDAEEARLEEERRATEAREAEEARLEEERRAKEEREAEEARIEEERRAKGAREAEEARLEEERRAKEARVAEEARLEEERRAKEAREAEEARLEEERRANEEREAEEARLEEERRANEAREAEEARLEEERRANEEREAEEARLEEERRATEAREAEEARLEEERRAKEGGEAEEARLEEERIAAEARQAEDARQAEETREAEESRLEEERRAAEARETDQDLEPEVEEASPSEEGEGASTSSEAEEEEEEEEIDEDWDEAARIVDEISAQIQEVLVATRSASKKEKAALLARKRDLESSPSYIDALAYLEDPEGEQRRRQEAEQEATRVVEEVAKQIAEVLSAMRTASKKEKPVLLAKKRELEKQPAYMEALQYLEDPVAERHRKRQATSSE